MKRCRDCLAEGITTRRTASYPGPRCATHHRAVREQRRLAAHGRRVETTYGITEAQYWAIYEYQDGRCFICRRASGRRKRLAVDHDHTTGEVRGLLCGTCNLRVIGHLRDDVEALQRAIAYLLDPPARAVLSPKSWY